MLGNGTDYLSANKDDEKEVPERLDWIAFKNQFFSSVFIADADFEKTKLVSKMEREGSGYIKDYSAEMSTSFDPTGKQPTQMFFYFGPNHYKTLTALDKGRDEKWELNRLVYLGWPLIRWVNKWFTINIFDWLSGWGLSMGIVLLLMTLIVKAVVFPATWKTYISSAKKLKNEKDEKVREQMTAEIKRLREERNKFPARNEMDSSIKRIKYVRYADDFLIGIIGSLEDCKTVKEDIKNYLKEALKLELSDEKTLITNAQKPAKFLGFDIFIRRSNDLRKDKNGRTVRAFGHVPVLYLNFETMRKKLFDYKAARIAVVNGKEVWKSIVRTYMIDLDDLEIVSQFNAEIRGFYNYYSIANNSPAINSFYHIMSYSMYKTFARKYKSSVKKILTKYKKGGTFKVAYENKKGKMLYQSFYHEGFKRKKNAGATSCDTIPRTVTITGGRNSLMERLKLQVCELCGATDKLEMHHVRKLKDLTGKSDWEKRMIARRRKTLAVCSKCHAKIDPDRRIRLN